MGKVALDYLHHQESIANPKSAIGNYLITLSAILSQGVAEVVQPMPHQKKWQTSLRSTSKLRHVFRLFAYFRKHWTHRNMIHSEMPNLSVVFHSPFQFLSVISFWKVPTAVIYDAPTEDLLSEFYLDHWILRKICRLYDAIILRRVTTIVVYGKSMQRYARALVTDRHKVQFVIHQNVDFARIPSQRPVSKPSSEALTMIFVGSFLPWHGVPSFLKSINELKTTKPVTIHMCGDGPDLERAKKIASELDQRFNVEFHGFVDPQKLQELLAVSDVGLMPNSNWFGAPAKMFEYLASDCFVYAPRTPTIEDVFQSASGVYLFDDGRAATSMNEFIEFVEQSIKNECSPAEWFFNRYSKARTQKVYLDMMTSP